MAMAITTTYNDDCVKFTVHGALTGEALRIARTHHAVTFPQAALLAKVEDVVGMKSRVVSSIKHVDYLAVAELVWSH